MLSYNRKNEQTIDQHELSTIGTKHRIAILKQRSYKKIPTKSGNQTWFARSIPPFECVYQVNAHLLGKNTGGHQLYPYALTIEMIKSPLKSSEINDLTSRLSNISFYGPINVISAPIKP